MNPPAPSLPDAILAAGHAFDRGERQAGAHQEFVAEVYEIAVTELKQQLVQLPREQAVGTLTREFSRACGRERYRRTRALVTGEEPVLSSGVPTSHLQGAARRSTLDALIAEENSRQLAVAVKQLPESERALLRTLTQDDSDGPTLAQLARMEGVHERTLQRRRKKLLDRLHRELEDV